MRVRGRVSVTVWVSVNGIVRATPKGQRGALATEMYTRRQRDREGEVFRE